MDRHHLHVHGIKVPQVGMENGDAMKTFAVMSVTTPLAAVSRVLKAGHRVVFQHEDSYVETLAGAKHPLVEKNGVYKNPKQKGFHTAGIRSRSDDQEAREIF